MIKLTIGNSMSQVEGLTPDQHKEMKDLLSYEADPQASFFSGSGRSRKRYLMSAKGVFPTGLLYLVEGYLQHVKRHVVTDMRIKPPGKVPLNLSIDVTPYSHQINAATAAMVKARGIISMTTGTGKSLVAALIITYLQVRTLIVVPSVELKNQLSESMKEWFGKDKVGKGKDIWIANVQSLDPEEVVEGYDSLIIDEFHHSGAKSYRDLNKKAWKNIYYRIGLTATPFRSNENERLLLESILSHVIYKLDYRIAIEHKYIVPIEAYYYDLPKREVEGYTWAQVYSELVVNNDNRNLLIAKIITSLKTRGVPTLTLVKEIAHGNRLADLTSVAFANGTEDNTRALINQFVSGERKSLIGTTGVLGEGVDTKPAEYIIIAGLGRSKNAFMQQIGRGLRKAQGKESCKIIIFRDSSHKWTLKHFKAQCKILADEYNVKAVKLQG